MGISGLLLLAVLNQQPVVTGVELRLPPETEPELVQEAPTWVTIRKGQQLSLRAVQRTIERLMNTGRFADVVVTGEESPGGIALVIEALPRRKVAEVFVEKETSALSNGAVVAASKLERGSEYSVESVAEALENVRQAYRRKGYLHAEVVPTATDGTSGVDVLLSVVEGQPTRLSSVSFAGEAGLPLQRLLQTLGIETGAIVDQDAVEKGAERLRELLKRERYYRARIEPPTLDDQGHLAIPLRSGPRYELQFHGNRRFPDSLLEAINAYDGSELLDRTVVDRMAQKLTAFYRFRGFHDAKVSGREDVSPDGRDALLVMEIDEGEVVVVRQLEFVGNEVYTDRELLAVLLEVMAAEAPQPAKLVSNYTDALQLEGRGRQPALFDVPAPALETVLVESAYRDGAQAIRALYRDRGYLDAKVELQPVEVEGRQAFVQYLVDEGRRFFVRQVKYEGGPEGFPAPGRSKSLIGEPFSARAIERAAQSLATDLAKRGYVYARVDAEWTFEKDEATVAFKILLGPEVHVGKVLVRGLKRTSEGVARRQLEIDEGEVLNPDKLLDSQRNLIALGIFRSAEVRLLSPETQEPVKDVLVELVETSRVQLEWSGGYFLAEGVRGGIDLQVPNLGGQAVSLASRVQLYYFATSAPALTGRVNVSNVPVYLQWGGRGNLSLQNRGLLAGGLAYLLALPWGENRASKALRSSDVGTRIDVLAERVFRQSYQFNRFAAVPGLDWSGRLDVGLKWARLKVTLLLQYEFDVSDVRPVAAQGELEPLLRSDQERLRFKFGTFALQTVRFAPTLDLRDDPVLPHKGAVLATSAEWTGALFAVDEKGIEVPVQFVKLSGQLNAYIPLGPAIVFAVSARAGQIFPVQQNSVTPPVKRFFVGGAASLRGFPEDGMLPEDARADIRAAIASCVSLALPAGCSSDAKTIRAGRYVPSLGGELFGIGKAELRFPFVGDFNVGLFFEAGNLWRDAKNATFALRPVAGTGLRYISPIGPLALDVGFNLQPDYVVNETLFNIHFNVGVF